MTENIRTASYLGVALVLCIVAALVNRKPTVDTADTLAGKVLFPELKSPEDVGGLEIVTTDGGIGQTEFRVARDSEGWSLPSHGDYPADAEKQVASAASSLIDLKALSVVTTSPSEHVRYGVVDPEKATPGAEGVGKLVKVLDKSGNPLARLVIGKKDTAGGGSLDNRELWFVRALPHDPIYRVALPTAKFSTSFADWIETDLLKLEQWEISDVTLKDYTFDVVPSPLTGQLDTSYNQLSTIELAFDDKESKWSLKKLVKFEKDQPQAVELGPDEELSSTRLNEMKTALDDLKIVGVRAKPAGMSANLKANKSIFTDRQALQSLADRGFYAVPGDDGQPEILSSDGEVVVQMKDGVEYTLRFGGVAGVGSQETNEEAAADAKDAGKSGEEKQDAEKGATLNRFIMVSARFNQELMPKPVLEPLPTAAGSEKAEDTTKSDEAGEKKAPETKTEAQEPAGESPDKGKEAAKSSEDLSPSKEGDKSAAAEDREMLHFVNLQADSADAAKTKAKAKDAKSAKNADGRATDKAKTAAVANQNEKLKSADAAADDDAKAGVPVNTDDAKTTDETKTDAGETTVDDANDAKAAAAKPSPEQQESLVLETKRIETENARKQKEYDEKIKKGEARAQELNARFAEWYYVVSEATYRKIHLNRDAVIQKKAADKKTDANGTGAADGGVETDPLDVPSLKIDPFQKRDEAAKEEDE